MTTMEKIDSLCRTLIIHSIIYYDLNSNIISDREYDKMAKELESLVELNRKDIKDCYYYECLKDYTAATGFDLKYKLEEEHREYLERIANWVLYLHDGDITTKGDKN